MATMDTPSAIQSDNSLNLKQRKVQVTEKLQNREEERLDDVRKRRDEIESGAVASERTDFFLQNFSKMKDEIEKNLEIMTTGTIAKSELPNHFDSLLVLVQKLQKYLTDLIMFIPTFEMQKAQHVILLCNIQKGFINVKVLCVLDLCNWKVFISLMSPS